MTTRQRSYVIPVFALFLFSGATSLAYQVIWTRMLIRTFGATSFAVSTVLAAFMAGLALGSYLFGRMIDRRGNPILTYGILELGIGAFALVFPLAIAALGPLYRSLYVGLEGQFYTLSLIRFLLSFTLVLIPATMMGGTLPVLSRYVARTLSNLTFRVGWLYSINTFGAVLGTFATGFVLLPALGMAMSTYTAVAANVAIFLISVFLSRGDTGPPVQVEAETGEAHSRPSPAYEKIVLVAFLFTGLAALSAEVIWTRVLTLVVGTTTYAFTTMLTTFLLGLALGSAVFARIAQKYARPRTLFALLVLAIGFLVFASTVAFGRLPILYMDLYGSIEQTWFHITSVQFLLSFALFIIPTFLMGGTFPLVARIYATDLARVGSRIGTAYAFNTVGSILGSFIGSFVLLNLLGVEHGMIAVSLIYLAVGVVLFLAVAEKMRPRLRAAGALAVVGVAAIMLALSPGWDRKLMTSAVYVYASNYGDVEGLRKMMERREILFYDEGPGATVSVERVANLLSIRIDGKVDASNSRDMITQELISHLPLLLHARPDTVLLIGLGSGVSLGSAQTYDVRHIDCIELLDNVVDAAHYFDEISGDAMEDPRVKMIIGDGRNHVRLTEKDYDVIISQPTNPWISGVGDLFTVEFFREARERLKPGGVMCAWFQIYHMGDPELRATLKAFVSVFPHSTLWFSNESDVVLIGSLEPVSIDSGVLGRMKRPQVSRDLARVGIDEPADLLAAYLMDEESLRAFAGRADRIHTDDNMLVEYRAGRRILESTHRIHLSNFMEALSAHEFPELSQELNREAARRVAARRLTMEGTLQLIEGRVKTARELFDRAYEAAPGDPYVLTKYFEIHYDLGDPLLLAGEYEQAIAEYKKALQDSLHPDAWAVYDGLGIAYMATGRMEQAVEALRTAVRLNPYSFESRFNLGDALAATGDTAGAIDSYREALRLDPDDPDAANNLAWFYAVTGRKLDRALELARKATARVEDASYFDTLGWVYYMRGEYADARKYLERALELETDRVESMYHLAAALDAAGDRAAARRLLERTMRLDGQGYYGQKAGEMLDEMRDD
jgi:spermidine synthase